MSSAPSSSSASGSGSDPLPSSRPPPKSIESSAFPLHECVFFGDVATLSALIRKNKDNLGLQDVHGNTALHLAVMMGKKEFVHLLLAHGAPVKIKNKAGWSPLAEAIR